MKYTLLVVQIKNKKQLFSIIETIVIVVLYEHNHMIYYFCYQTEQ